VIKGMKLWAGHCEQEMERDKELGTRVKEMRTTSVVVNCVGSDMLSGLHSCVFLSENDEM